MQDLETLIASNWPGGRSGPEDFFTLSGIRAAPAIGPPIMLEPEEPPPVNARTKIGLAVLFLGTVGLVAVTFALLQGSKRGGTGHDPGGISKASALAFAAPDEHIGVALGGENGALYNLISSEAKDPPVEEKVHKAETVEKPNVAHVKVEKKKSKKTKKKRRKYPASLSRDQINARLKKVAHRVRRCDQGSGGVVVLRITIGKNGKVARSKAAGAFAGTVTGKCAARAVRKARFPKFSGPKMKVTYPFRL